MAPPIVPGIPEKNSKSLIEFFSAYFDKVVSKTPAPTLMLSFLSFILLKFLPNLMIIPLYPWSLTNRLEQTPIT